MDSVSPGARRVPRLSSTEGALDWTRDVSDESSRADDVVDGCKELSTLWKPVSPGPRRVPRLVSNGALNSAASVSEEITREDDVVDEEWSAVRDDLRECERDDSREVSSTA